MLPGGSRGNGGESIKFSRKFSILSHVFLWR